MANCLELNVVKTKELVIHFRSGVHHPTPVNINGQHIEIVHSYKCLGTTIDGKLRWDDNTMNLYKKGQQILYFLRKLRQKHFICVPRFICKKCYDVRSCLLVGKSLSQKQRKTKQNIHNFLQDRYMLYTRYQPRAIVQVKYTANSNQKSYLTHPLLTRPLRPSPLWKEVQNANSKNPASP